MKIVFSALAIAATLVLSGCATQKSDAPTYDQVAANSFTSTNHAAISKLVAGIEAKDMVKGPILVATVVNVNNMGLASPLGRTLGEQYSTAMSKLGFHVTEMKLRDNVFLREESGEMMLSREIKDIAKQQKSDFVLVGTYSQAKTMTLVSVKLVSTNDARIVSAQNYALPNDADVLKLLSTK